MFGVFFSKILPDLMWTRHPNPWRSDRQRRPVKGCYPPPPPRTPGAAPAVRGGTTPPPVTWFTATLKVRMRNLRKVGSLAVALGGGCRTVDVALN